MATTGQTYTLHAHPAIDSPQALGSGVLSANCANRRLEPRGITVLPLMVRTEEQECVGLLRDLSQTGLFFYCSLSPKVGSEVEVLIRPSAADPSVAVRCRCRVVRTEASVPGAATGVGVTIEEYLGEGAQAEAAVADSMGMSS